MKIKNVLVYTGYVESASWSAIPFSHRTGFDSVEDALHHLGECILTGFRLEEKYTYFPECCRKSMEEALKFCGKCGRNIEKRSIDRERLADMIVDLRTGNNDSIPHEIWEILDTNGWCFFGGPHDKDNNDFTDVIVLGDHGEYTLADAAFGRLFDHGPVNEDSLYGDFEEKTEKERRKDCKDRYRIRAPKGAKFFLDD